MMEDLLPWLILKAVPGIGNLLFKRLLARFESPDAVLSASLEALLQVEGIGLNLATAIVSTSPSDGVKQELALIRKKGATLLLQTDPTYPPLLREIPDPPPFLYVWGTLPTDRHAIAIVGSRNASEYGLRITRQLARDMGSLGWTVVSGMALGIDTAAHEGALSGGGKTVAVLGSGLGRIYPAENTKLCHAIAAQGAVISELPLLAPPDAHHFPARNRIISGLCLGTVVVEAARQSGSLITARLAAEQGREVFAVPGSVQSFKSTGTHLLIREGARLVERAGDILEELSPMVTDPAALPQASGPAPPPDLSDEENRVLSALEVYPIHVDELARRLDMAVGKLSALLLALELKGVATQLPGAFYCLGAGDLK